MAVSGNLNLFTSTSSRISGLATGFDTDQMVSDLMKVERIPLNKLYQKKQLAEWKRDNYRDITNLLRGVKDTFFNTLKSASNMLSQSNYKKFIATSSDNTIVAASGSSDAIAGTHKITVQKLATADEAVSAANVSKAVRSSSDMTTEAEKAAFLTNIAGKKLSINLNGVTREITIGSYTTIADLAAGIQSSIDQAFGSGKITVNNSVDSEWYKINFVEADSNLGKFTLYSASDTALDALGLLKISSGTSNRLDVGMTLQEASGQMKTPLAFSGDQIQFTINDQTFTFDSTDTIASMLSTINSNEDAKVNMTYDEISGKFKITAEQLGAGDNIRIVDIKGNFFSGASGISSANPVTKEGIDSEVLLDGQLIKRGSNMITANGITYNLLKESATEQTIGISNDVDGTYNNIKAFVDKYNEMISNINTEINEKYDRDYQPLTDVQKSQMEADDIKIWEDKAKTGLLHNDSLLQNIVYSIRKALTDEVKDVSTNLSAIGITTGTYDEKGKLIIDETKLKNAIRNNTDQVMNLFAKKSSVDTNINLSSDQRMTRYNEEGLAYRIFDVIENNIRTIRDSGGKKGLLLERAGIQDDVSEFKNTLYDQINDYSDSIKDLTEKLTDKEERYYEKYAALESYISKMNSQSSWLASQLGTS